MCAARTSTSSRPIRQRAIQRSRRRPFWCSRCKRRPARAKPTRCRALRAAAPRGGKEVLVVAPTGKAVDEAMRDGAGDRGLTVAKALHSSTPTQLALDRRTVVVVDEASMVGTPELRRLLEATTAARTKPCWSVTPTSSPRSKPAAACSSSSAPTCPGHSASPRCGGCATGEERDASLALRSGRGNRLRKAIGWYRTHGRLHTGDPIAMAADATTAYIQADRADGKDAAAGLRHLGDRRRHQPHACTTPTPPDGPSARIAPRPDVRVGDHHHQPRQRRRPRRCEPGVTSARGEQVDQVRNGNRWRVPAVDPEHGRIAAERLTDLARVIFDGDYLREHITLGYAITVHAAQGITVGTCTPAARRHHLPISHPRHGLRRDDPRPRQKPPSIYPAVTNEADQHHRGDSDTAVHPMVRGTKYAAAQYLR